MRKTTVLILTILMIACISPIASAASNQAIESADYLYSIGLFQGTGTDAVGNPNYELDRSPNRYEAVTMLVRLLGKEDEALAGNWESPFTDVVAWAQPYVGYAYANGLTFGTGANTFSGADTVSAAQYITFILRALGYSSEEDFAWDSPWTLSDSLGVTYGQYPTHTWFHRADVAIASYKALSARMKDTGASLLSVLINAKDLPGIYSIGDTIDFGDTQIKIIKTSKSYSNNGSVYLNIEFEVSTSRIPDIDKGYWSAISFFGRCFAYDGVIQSWRETSDSFISPNVTTKAEISYRMPDSKDMIAVEVKTPDTYWGKKVLVSLEY